MPASAFTQQGFRAWFWCFLAYWRLWPILFRLRFSSFEWLRAQLELRPAKLGQSNVIHTQEQIVLAMHEAVRLASRLHLARADCLPKSIVLVRMLQNQGLQARAVIGVTKQSQQFASHAWVEVCTGNVWQMVAEPESMIDRFNYI